MSQANGKAPGKFARYRSAITGRFVKLAVWRRWPKTTIKESEEGK